MMGAVYANTGGYTKKMVVYALSYIGYSVGNIVGPLTFTSDQAPRYTGGVIAMLTCYCIALFLILIYRYVSAFGSLRNFQQYLLSSVYATADGY